MGLPNSCVYHCIEEEKGPFSAALVLNLAHAVAPHVVVAPSYKTTSIATS